MLTPQQEQQNRILSGRLNSGDIESYVKKLKKSKDPKVTFTPMLNSFGRLSGGQRAGAQLSDVRDLLSNNMNDLDCPAITIVPIALAATPWLPFAEDHVALLIINRDTHQIYYYDPKGGDLATETRELAALPKGAMTGKAFLETLKGWNATRPDYEYQCYKPKGFWASVLGWFFGLGKRLSSHQGAFDRTSCGIFVASAIERYLEKQSFDDIAALPPKFSITQQRKKMAKAVASKESSMTGAGSLDADVGASSNPPLQQDPRPSEAGDDFEILDPKLENDYRKKGNKR